MKIESHQKIKPDYQHLVDEYENHIKVLTEMVLDKYDKQKYKHLKFNKPDVYFETVHNEILQITEGVREQYVNLLAVATEIVIVVKL